MTATEAVPSNRMPGDGETYVDGDPFDVRLARRVPQPLSAFNRAGVLTAAEVQVAMCLVRLVGREATAGAAGAAGTAGEVGPAVLLAAALAVRAPRLGHVCTDLATIAGTVALDAELPLDIGLLPWPEPEEWVEQMAASPLVASGANGEPSRPLRLAGTRLYLDRYWGEEVSVATELLARAEGSAAGVDQAVLGEGLTRLFNRHEPMPSRNPVFPTLEDGGSTPDHQPLAAAAAVLRRFSVVAGGPGTGKTTTVARILALLHEQAEAAGTAPPLVALAAPTGKAAARLEEAVHAEAVSLDVTGAVRARLLAVEASTLHRLLGWRPGNRSRFRHHRGNRLPHEVVVVDETSMVSLSLMARLVEAVRPTARLVLVGDPEQLASVEAGAVLGDIVGPAAGGLLMREACRSLLSDATGRAVPAAEPPPGAGAGIGDGIVVLRHVHRFGGGIAALAEAVRQGDADVAVALLGTGSDDLTWIADDIGGAGGTARGAGAGLAPVREAAVEAAAGVIHAARAGEGRAALEALGAFRILCAHRHGPYGVTTWMERVERWLLAGVDGFAAAGEWYAGRPLLVTENDYGLGLYNGDTGVVVDDGRGGLVAAFGRGGVPIMVPLVRLGAVRSLHAMTVHRGQGSQFARITVLLPAAGSPLGTRETLYTAVTRATSHVRVIGSAEAFVEAVCRPAARATGLRERLQVQPAE